MKEGDTATMLFYGFGETSEEEFTVIGVNRDTVVLNTDEDYEKCYRFNFKTGECLNDNTTFGCSRSLKIT